MAQNKLSNIPKAHKIVIVGDGLVGKTCLLIRYTQQKFPNDYVPTVFDNYFKNIIVDNKPYRINLWDTAGQENYERLRTLSYPGTECFILCYSIDSVSSYQNVRLKWYPELHNHCPNVPIVLVATKTDLRNSSSPDDKIKSETILNKLIKKNSEKYITHHQGNKLKKQIKADIFLECTALENQGLEEIFKSAVRCVVNKNNKKSCCNIL